MTTTAAPAGLWRRWFLVVTAGELVGFTVPAVVGALTASAAGAGQIPALVAAGLVEGGFLGAAQASVLRRMVSGLPVARFVVATAAAAGLAYAVAMVPVAMGDRFTALPWPVMAALAVVLGAVLLGSIGTAQWLVLRLVLRGHTPGIGFWIPATAGAWLAGLGAFVLVAPPLWQEGQPVGTIIAIGVLGGLVMAATVAALTGLAALRLARAAVH